MALMRCPECKKSISTEAATCPKCGVPITAEHVEAAAQQRKATRLGCLTFFAVFLVVGLWAVMRDSKDMPTRSAVEKTLRSSQLMGSTEVADLYGGKAVLSSNGAAWWVKDGTVYSANGVALGISNAPTAPPSVDFATIKRAIEGDNPPLPPNLGIPTAVFVRKVNAALTAAKLQNLTEETRFSYSATVGAETTGELRMEEVGGMLTSVFVEATREDMDSPRHKAQIGMVMAAVSSLLPGGEAEWDQALAVLFRKGETTGSYATGNLVFTSEKKDRSFSITVKPKP